MTLQGEIAIFVPSIRSGGAEKQACMLACVLAPDYRVRFVSFVGKSRANPANVTILESAPNLQVCYLEGNVLSRLVQFYGILRRNKVEVLFNYLTFCDFFGAIIGKMAHVSRIFGGIRNSKLPFAKHLVERFIHNAVSDKTVFNSYAGAEYFISKGYKRNRVEIISNCFATVCPPIVHPDRALKQIITVARFVSQKDYYTALLAIKELSRNRSDFEYLIVGYGPLEAQIRKWVAALEIERFVKIFIRPDNIPELLRGADIYLSTSLFEGTSNSIMEAMDACLPVVGTDVGDNCRLVEHLQNGALHPVKNYQAIAASLDHLLSDATLRKSCGAKGHDMLQNGYCVEVFGKKYRDLLEKEL